MAVLSKLKLIVNISRSKIFFNLTPSPQKDLQEQKGPKLNKTTIDVFNLIIALKITQQDSERLKEYLSCSKKNKISYTFEAKYDCRNNNFGFELSHNQSCKPVFSKGNFLGLVNAPVMCILNFLNSNSYFSKFNYSYLNFSNFYLSNTNFSKNLGQNTEIQAFFRLF